jgi:hypothetical protein
VPGPAVNGAVYGHEGEVIRTCINAPEGPIEIDLQPTSKDRRMATVTENGHRTNGHVAIDTDENSLHRLTPEQIEEIGREFDELHEQVKPTSAIVTPAISAR